MKNNFKFSGTYIEGAYDGFFGDYTNTDFVYNLADVNKSVVTKALQSRSFSTVNKPEVLDQRAASLITCETMSAEVHIHFI